MAAPDITNDESISLPIRTFHMLCERLSTIEEQNRDIKRALIHAECMKLGHLDHTLLGCESLVYQSRQADEPDELGGEIIIATGHLGSKPYFGHDMRVFVPLTDVVPQHRLETIIKRAFSHKSRPILDVIVTEAEHNVLKRHPLAFGVIDAERPDILDEALRRLVNTANAGGSFEIEFLTMNTWNDDGMVFLVNMKALYRQPTRIIEFIKALTSIVVDLFDIHPLLFNICYLRSYPGFYLNAIRAISKNRKASAEDQNVLKYHAEIMGGAFYRCWL